MDTNSVWEALSKIPIGNIISIGAVVCSVIFTLYKAAIKLFEIFSKYKAVKEDDEYQKALLKEHDKVLESVNESLSEIKASLEEQKDVNLKQIRHTIVHTCDDAIALGYITAGKLKSLEEMFDEYTIVFHGNGYVKTLVEKTRALPVKGRLDE